MRCSGTSRIHKRSRGISIVEFGATLCIGLPLLITIIYAAVEMCRFYAIKSVLDVAARTAARTIAINYGQGRTNLNQADTYTPSAKVPGFISPSANQFQRNYDNKNPPTTITVTCSYPAGGKPAAGLAPFPQPDVFGLGDKFTISSTVTLPLEE